MSIGDGSESITEIVATMTLQLGIIVFAVKLFGRLAKKIGISKVLGELFAGIVIGPFALGGIPLPGLPHGIFPNAMELFGSSLPVSNELYAIAAIASVILLFASGLETDIALFLRYSVVGSIVGLGGVVLSFFAGALAYSLWFGVSIMHPSSLFLGILCTATSLGITARILSENKKMDSPEGVTTVAAAVIDDVLCIISFAVVMGVVAVMTGTAEAGAGLNTGVILGIAGKAFGIWLGFTALALIFSRKIAGFLKGFKNITDFTVLGLGIALALAGIFEKQGLAMIIGAYIAGLSLSKSDIAPVVEERLEGIYEFLVPIFFAVMGMMVNVREIFSPEILIFGAVYTVAAIASKIIGCGGSAMLMGFNVKGSLRIGLGMVPRGEMVLILAGVGLAAGILDTKLFGVAILMTLITTIFGPPVLAKALNSKGAGTRKPSKNDDSVSAEWKFASKEIADIVLSNLLNDLRSEDFYIQTISDEGISKARKDDTVLFIIEEDNMLTIQTAKSDIGFVKTLVYEVIVELYEAISELKGSSDPQAMKMQLLNKGGRMSDNLISLITPDCVSINILGCNKNEILTELVELLFTRKKLLNKDLVLRDVLNHEKAMDGSGMDHNIALPHARSDGVSELVIAIGIKKDGADFHSTDGEKSKIIVLCVSPKRTNAPFLQFISTIESVLIDETTHDEVINADSPEKVVEFLHMRARMRSSAMISLRKS